MSPEDFLNPAHPLSPLNPLNPASPFYDGAGSVVHTPLTPTEALILIALFAVWILGTVAFLVWLWLRTVRPNARSD
ncbi:MAG: hypothetical protein JOY70_11365 [Acidisphaera sp.]|nr:hypothetical protein [Acidisphaera sp.]